MNWISLDGAIMASSVLWPPSPESEAQLAKTLTAEGGLWAVRG